MARGTKRRGYETVRDMVLAWIVTLPAAGILAWLAYFLLNRLG